MPACGAIRSDGAACLDVQGHYGGHAWPELQLPVVVVGDTIWFYVELLRQVSDEPNPVRVRVKEIRTEADGAKMLMLERA